MDNDAKSYSEYELHHLSSAESSRTATENNDHGTRRAVRIASTAHVIPTPDAYTRVQTDDVESTAAAASETIADAETLWNAHSQGKINPDQSLVSAEQDESEGYAATGSAHGGLFYHLLQAYKNPEPVSAASLSANHSASQLASQLASQTATPSETTPSTPGPRPGSSGKATPRRKWYEQERDLASRETLSTLVGAAHKLANPAAQSSDPTVKRRHHKRTSSGNIISKVLRPKDEQDTKIKLHVATILKRQQYIIKMCRAMMLFGAPTHRLEESLAQSAKILEINAQFLYIPGCMIISFDDVLTHTAEVKLVRTTQGVNLGKLSDTHDIYKEVLHDVIGLDEALTRLDAVISRKDRHPSWLNILMYGLASTAVSTFFKARLIDMPIIFVLGTLLGVLQLVVSPLSNTYSTVFEITAAVLMSFLARVFGSISGGSIFCFSAIAQSSIALILPGWLVLSSALELQSRAIVPGSIRLVYAILYSLFLGYGITLGTALYGAIDPHATTDTTCQNTLDPYWNFLFVPLYVLFTCFIVQAKYKQMPVMILVATCGYIVNFYSNKKFTASQPIAYTLGAFTVGVLANLYSRVRHGVAAAILLPAVYVQVPGSLASSGSIVAALDTASQLVRGEESNSSESLNSLNSIVFNFAGGMIQISLGITVGLFMSALVVYPLGKRRSGLWTL